MSDDQPTSPILRSSAGYDPQKGYGRKALPLPGAGDNNRYSKAEIQDLPPALMLNRQVWKRADEFARAEVSKRRVEMVTQEFGPENPARELLATNMTRLAKKYPNMDPDALLGLAASWTNPLADPDTAEPMSDQGQAEAQMFDNVYMADVLSSIDAGTFGATAANPLPTMPDNAELGGLSGLRAALETANAPVIPAAGPQGGLFPGLPGYEPGTSAVGSDIVPGEAPIASGEANVAERTTFSRLTGGWFDSGLSPIEKAKRQLNTNMNALRAIPEMNNAAAETSAGNEKLAGELARRADMTVEQADQLFGNYNQRLFGDSSEVDNTGNPLSHWTTDIDPGLLVTEAQQDGSDVPLGDITFEQAQALWNKHLVETEQITEDGQSQFGNITGRTSLGQQERSGTQGQGGWFGGVPNPQHEAMTALAMRQSDMGSFAERTAAEARASAKRATMAAAGQDLTLDEYTRLRAVRTFTEGRATTQMFGLAPGSVAEMTISGAIDMVFTLGTDPTSYIPTGIPSGAGKAGLAALSRGRLFGLEQAAKRAGDDITRIGEDLTFQKVGSEYLLHDEAGNVVANSPRLVRDSYKYVADTGHEVTRVGRNWEIHTPEYIADPATAPAPARFRTKREAQDALPLSKAKKVEFWREANSTTSTQSLDEAIADNMLEYTRATGQQTKAIMTSQRVWDWIETSEMATKFIDAAVAETSPYMMWLRSGKQFSLEQARQLSSAQSAPEVKAILAHAVGPDIRNSQGIGKFMGARGTLTNAKIKLANKEKMSMFYRLSESSPRPTVIDASDMDDMVREAHALGTAMGLKPSDLRSGIDSLISTGGGKAASDYFHGALSEQVFRQGLLDEGVSAVRVDKLLGQIRKERQSAMIETNRAQSRRAGTGTTFEEVAATALEQRMAGGALLDNTVPDGTFGHGIDDEAALHGQEVIGSTLVIPTVRDVRREVSTVAKMMHRREDDHPDFFDKVTKASSGFLDNWRNLTLFNGPYITRSFSEELFTMGMRGRTGLLTQPVRGLAAIIAAHNGQEYASGFRGVSRAVRNARAATGAERRARVRPDEYQGARMVMTHRLTRMLNIAPQQFDEAVGRSGRKVGWDRFVRQTREGIIDPIVVTVDHTTKRVMVSSGNKRLQAAIDNGLTGVPVKIKPGKVAANEGTDLDPAMALAPKGQREAVMAGEYDPIHETLFGRRGVIGDIGEVTAQARRAVNDQIAMKAGLKYAAPWFSGTQARINGESMYGRLEDAIKAGDNAAVEREIRALTRLNGSALMDEHPAKMLKRGTSAEKVELQFKANGWIDWENENSRRYAASVADTVADLASVKEVRQILSGARTIDTVVEDVIADPRRLEDLLTVLDDAIGESVARRGTRIPDGMTPEAMEDYYRTTMRGKPEEAVRGYFQALMNDVSMYFGNNAVPEMRQIVASARFQKKALGSENKEFVRYVRELLDNNDDFRNALPPLVQPFDAFSDKIWTSMVNGFFNTAGNIRDMVTLNPLLRQVYAEEVIRLGKYLTPEDHAKALKSLRDLGDRNLAKQFEKVPPSSDGWMDIRTAERLAETHARRTADDEFYNAMNRQNWAVALRWASPFAQAAASTTRRWGRSLLKDPLSTYRTIRNVEGLRDGIGEYVAGSGDPTGLQSVAGIRGTLDQDQFGDDISVYPAIGMLATVVGGAFTGGDESFAATYGSKTLDLFQSGIIGTGPVITFALSMTPFRNLESDPDLFGDIFRFLQPYGVNQEAGAGNLIVKSAEAFLPAKWVGIVRQDPKQTEAMATAIVMSRLSTGEYGPMHTWTKQQSEDIKADVMRDSRTMIVLESLSKLGVPTLGGFSFSPLIEMPDGMNLKGIPEGKEGAAMLVTHMLKAEYDRYMEGAKTLDERSNRMAVFLHDWGNFAQFASYGSTESLSGITYSNPESAKFAEMEPDLYRKHRESIGYLFPGGDWGAEWDNFDQALREKDKASGVIRQRTTDEQWDFLRQKAMQTQKAKERAELERSGADAEAIRELEARYVELGLKQKNSEWTKRHLANLRTIVSDPEVIASVPSAQYIKDYLDLRDKVVASLAEQDLVSFSGEEAAQTSEVRWLYATGSKAAAEDPGFGNFWESLAVDEFIAE